MIYQKSFFFFFFFWAKAIYCTWTW